MAGRTVSLKKDQQRRLAAHRHWERRSELALLEHDAASISKTWHGGTRRKAGHELKRMKTNLRELISENLTTDDADDTDQHR